MHLDVNGYSPVLLGLNRTLRWKISIPSKVNQRQLKSKPLFFPFDGDQLWKPVPLSDFGAIGVDFKARRDHYDYPILDSCTTRIEGKHLASSKMIACLLDI